MAHRPRRNPYAGIDNGTQGACDCNAFPGRGPWWGWGGSTGRPPSALPNKCVSVTGFKNFAHCILQAGQPCSLATTAVAIARAGKSLQ